MDIETELRTLYTEFDTQRLQDSARIPPGPDLDPALASTSPPREGADTDLLADIAAELAHCDLLVTIGSVVPEPQALAALELAQSYHRPFTSLVLDIDRTLRTPDVRDNRIPPEAADLLERFWADPVPLIVSTGKGLGFVRGLFTQALGRHVTESEWFCAVYETGAGLYAPKQGADTKQQLFTALPDPVTETVAEVRGRVLASPPGDLDAHLYFEEKSFAVTLVSAYETHCERAHDAVERGLVHLLRTLGTVVREADSWEAVAAHYASRSPMIDDALADRYGSLDGDPSTLSAADRRLVEAIDVNYYPGDAVELTSNRFDKATGLERALKTLDISDPFSLVMGDSRTDLRMMEAVAQTETGIPAAPTHASDAVLDHVAERDGLTFEPGEVTKALQTAYAYHHLQQAGVV